MTEPVKDEIEVKEEAPIVEVVEEKPKKEKQEAISGEDGVEMLKKQLQEAREARQKAEEARADAERRAYEASRSAHTAKSEVEDTNLRMVENAIETLKGNEKALTSALEQASANSDHKAIAELTAMLTNNSAKLRDLENGKEAMAAQPKAPPPRPADPVEALAVQLTPRSAAWVRAHPEFARDQDKYASMVAAHNLAVARGIRADSDEYFRYVEKTLEITPSRAKTYDEDEGDEFSDAAAPVARRSSPLRPRSPGRQMGRGLALTPAQCA